MAISGGYENMINIETRKKIEKALGDVENIDEYFRECYRYIEDGESYIVVYPVDDPNNELTTMYNEETGEFMGLQRWSWIKKYGELL